MTKILTKQEAKEYRMHSFANGDYRYTINGTEHLIRNGKEIAKGNYIWSYDNGDYKYEIGEKIYRFTKDGAEIIQ